MSMYFMSVSRIAEWGGKLKEKGGGEGNLMHTRYSGRKMAVYTMTCATQEKL